MQTANFWATIQIMSGFVIACGVCVFGVRLNNWQSRQRAVGNDLSSIGSMTGFHFMIHANMIAFHTLVLLGFPFAFMICCYW